MNLQKIRHISGTLAELFMFKSKAFASLPQNELKKDYAKKIMIYELKNIMNYALCIKKRITH